MRVWVAICHVFAIHNVDRNPLIGAILALPMHYVWMQNVALATLHLPLKRNVVSVMAGAMPSAVGLGC
jgi:hypothetical protein